MRHPVRGMIMAALLVAAIGSARAAVPESPLNEAGILSRDGAAVPLDEVVVDETGQPTSLRRLLDGHAGLLALVDLDCRLLCGMTMSDLLHALADMPSAARGFETVILSIDEREGPAQAAAVRHKQVDALGGGWPGAHVRLATSRDGAVARIADALGYSYRFDPGTDQFAHPAAVAVVRADGRLGRWLFGYPFEPGDIGLALEESAPTDVAQRTWLLCYRYDPTTGRYTLAVDRILMAAGVATSLALAGGVGTLLWRERRNMR